MIGRTLGLILAAVAASTVHVEYIAPVASGYIYRSDHNAPASLIQVGAPYTKVEAPVALGPQKLTALETYDLLAPARLPYVAAKPIVEEDAEEDAELGDYVDGRLEGLKHGHAYEKGEGNDYGEEHHAAHGEKGSKGYHSKGHLAKGKAGNYGKAHKGGFYHESKGEKSAHHDEADAKGKYYVAGTGYKGGDHGHKEYNSKGEDITGYHKVFNKDEYKKDHDFYDVADHKGHFNKHGYAKSHHGAEKGAAEKAGHHDAAFDKGGFEKTGFLAKGHIDDIDAGLDAEEDHESGYTHHKGYKQAGGRGHKKEYGYSKGDDGIDYDDSDGDDGKDYDDE